MIGRTIGRYRILSKLGEGGMGTVWRAEDPLLQRTIALKFLPVSLADSPEARQRFLREARAASALHHSGIATVFDVGEFENQIYIAMHLVEGETLNAKVQRGALPVAEAVRIAIEAGTALAHAHAHGVLHRDVSSRNIMVDREGQVVVVDFGLAHPEGKSKLTQSGTWMGTVAYVAPEVLQGGKGDARSDVYSLGVVLYEMLTGRLPFTGERQEAVMYAAVHEAPEPPSRQRSDSAALDAVVLRALAKRPAERYGTAAEMVVALKGIAAVENATKVTAIAASMTSAPRRSVRHPWTIAFAALALTSTALALAFLRERRVSQEGAVETQAPRVAVLPLQNVSADLEESGFLVEGIGASLATKLSKVLGATVIPWVTSRRFVDATDLVQTASQLRVDALVVGTLRQAGETVKVSIALVDGQTGAQRWSDEFEETFSDIFALEALIATSTAAQLKGRLTGNDEETLRRAVSRDSEAYLRYLRGSQAMNAGTREGTETAFEFFQSALELDPDLAEAHVGLGAVHLDRQFKGFGNESELDEAESHFHRALALDPTLHAARSGLVRIHWRREEREAILELGVEARALAEAARRAGKEDLDALLVCAEAFFLGGFADAAVPLFEGVLVEDPANQAARWHLVVAYNWSGRDKEAIEAGDEYMSEYGADPEVLTWVGSAYQNLGDPEQALLYYRQAIELFGDVSNMYVYLMAYVAWSDLGEPEKGRQILEKAREEFERLASEFPGNDRVQAMLVTVRGALGDRELVLHEAEKALRGEAYFSNDLYLLLALHGEYSRAAEIACLILEQGSEVFKVANHNFWIRGLEERVMQQPGVSRCIERKEERVRELRKKYEIAEGLP